MNLYQHAKNQVISSISAEDKGDLKIQQSGTRFFPNMGFLHEDDK